VPGDFVVWMYLTMAIAFVALGYGVWRQLRIWLAGKPERRWDRPGQRLRLLPVHGLGQGRLLRRRLAGIAHALLFYAFIVLFVGTVVVFIHHDLGIPVLRGLFYRYSHSLALDVFGLLATVGLGLLL